MPKTTETLHTYCAQAADKLLVAARKSWAKLSAEITAVGKLAGLYPLNPQLVPQLTHSQNSQLTPVCVGVLPTIHTPYKKPEQDIFHFIINTQRQSVENQKQAKRSSAL